MRVISDKQGVISDKHFVTEGIFSLKPEVTFGKLNPSAANFLVQSVSEVVFWRKR